MRRTSGTRIRSLIRVVSRSGGRRSNLRGTGTSYGEGSSSGVEHSSGKPLRKLVHGHRSDVPLAVLAHGDGAVSASRSPTTSMKGTLRSSASRILRPTDSVRSSTSARTPAFRSCSSTPRAASTWRSAIGSTRAWVGASHSGSSPAVSSSEDPDEPLVRAEQRAVEHDHPVVGVVGAGVGQVEALGEVEVHLDGPELPRAAERVLEVQVDLRAVERAVTLVDDVLEALRPPAPWRGCPRPRPTPRRCRCARQAGSRARASA